MLAFCPVPHPINHVDMEIGKFQKDSDFVLHEAIFVKRIGVGVEGQGRVKRAFQGEGYTEENTSNLTLCQ